MDKITENAERNKIKADIFLKNDTKAFIEDFFGTYYWCLIREVTSEFIKVYNLAGKRKGETDKLYLVDIIRLEELEEKE